MKEGPAPSIPLDLKGLDASTLLRSCWRPQVRCQCEPFGGPLSRGCDPSCDTGPDSVVTCLAPGARVPPRSKYFVMSDVMWRICRECCEKVGSRTSIPGHPALLCSAAGGAGGLRGPRAPEQGGPRERGAPRGGARPWRGARSWIRWKRLEEVGVSASAAGPWRCSRGRKPTE